LGGSSLRWFHFDNSNPRSSALIRKYRVPEQLKAGAKSQKPNAKS